MVAPNQRRVSVFVLVNEFGVSERRACVLVSQHHGTQLHCSIRSPQEMSLRQWVRALSVKYPHYSYRRIRVMLLRDCRHCQDIFLACRSMPISLRHMFFHVNLSLSRDGW